jgi:hypothetical protein
MMRFVETAGAVTALLLVGGASGALPIAAPASEAARPTIVAVVERPEIRSFQPYSGLQYGFRPTPRPQRGVVEKRPRVVTPTPVPPLIEYGTPTPYSAQWYTYCAEKYRSFEPSTGRYTTYSGVERICR